MDLTEKYIDEIQKINGIYVMQVPNDMTDEDKNRFMEEWTMVYPDETIVMLPKEVILSYRNRHSFYVAMMLVRGGQKVARLDWERPPVDRKRDLYLRFNRETLPYLQIEMMSGEEVVLKKFPDKSEEDEFYIPIGTDMDAEDFVIIKD